MNQKTKDKISATAFKARGLLWGIFALGVIAFPCRYSWTRIIIGAVILIAGQLLRLWAAGYIPKYRTEVIGAPELITDGPYSWVRNPLYLGNFIMGIGWALWAGLVWVAIFVVFFYVLYDMIIIPAEEKFLGEKFGEDYKAYTLTTSRLIPNFRHVKTPAKKQFNLKTAYEMEKYSIRMNVIITILIAVRLYFTR